MSSTEAAFSLSLDIPEKCFEFISLKIFWRERLKISAFVPIRQAHGFGPQKPRTGPDLNAFRIGNCLLELKKVLCV